MKRVLFELFDCYLPLFYIAFYQLNIIALRRELVGLFWGKFISNASHIEYHYTTGPHRPSSCDVCSSNCRRAPRSWPRATKQSMRRRVHLHFIRKQHALFSLIRGFCLISTYYIDENYCLHFSGDEIRRLVTESIIPLITEKISSYQQKKKFAAVKKDDDLLSTPDIEVGLLRRCLILYNPYKNDAKCYRMSKIKR